MDWWMPLIYLALWVYFSSIGNSLWRYFPDRNKLCKDNISSGIGLSVGPVWYKCLYSSAVSQECQLGMDHVQLRPIHASHQFTGWGINDFWLLTQNIQSLYSSHAKNCCEIWPRTSSGITAYDHQAIWWWWYPDHARDCRLHVHSRTTSYPRFREINQPHEIL